MDDAAVHEIVLATGNPHKAAELSAVFSALLPPDRAVRLQTLSDLDGAWVEPAESGATFFQNAMIKAISYARQTGRLCLADDSGLEIDALGGRPGVISSHYCTDGRETGMSRAERDLANNERVLSELEGISASARAARFVCVMVLARPTQGGAELMARSMGTFEGRIGLRGDVPRGNQGFGYDPLFVLPEPDSRTSAELTPYEKNERSHRGAAARAMARLLGELLGPTGPNRP